VSTGLVFRCAYLVVGRADVIAGEGGSENSTGVVSSRRRDDILINDTAETRDQKALKTT
jgi:hypothetical protein